jgi:tripartite-type tricarboxylate transporter receptor subunit TctC
MPTDVTKRLNAAINKVILEPEIKNKLQDNGAEIMAMSIDQFAGFVQTEIEKYQAIIRAADIKAD